MIGTAVYYAQECTIYTGCFQTLELQYTVWIFVKNLRRKLVITFSLVAVVKQVRRFEDDYEPNIGCMFLLFDGKSTCLIELNISTSLSKALTKTTQKSSSLKWRTKIHTANWCPEFRNTLYILRIAIFICV